MAVTIDDGTFLIGDSFVEVVEADTFHSARENDVWEEANLQQKEAALRKAFDYLSVQNWKSDAFTLGIPLKVKNAQCLGALKELGTPGGLQPDITPGVKSESIEGVVETQYFEGSGGGTIYTAVENLIKPFLKHFGMRMKLVRGGG